MPSPQRWPRLTACHLLELLTHTTESFKWNFTRNYTKAKFGFYHLFWEPTQNKTKREHISLQVIDVRVPQMSSLNNPVCQVLKLHDCNLITMQKQPIKDGKSLFGLVIYKQPPDKSNNVRGKLLKFPMHAFLILSNKTIKVHWAS